MGISLIGGGVPRGLRAMTLASVGADTAFPPDADGFFAFEPFCVAWIG